MVFGSFSPRIAKIDKNRPILTLFHEIDKMTLKFPQIPSKSGDRQKMETIYRQMVFHYFKVWVIDNSCYFVCCIHVETLFSGWMCLHENQTQDTACKFMSLVLFDFVSTWV